jgi:hypothetical protein
MVPRKRAFQLLVFFTAFCCLMFELIVSRIADFHLDFRNSYLALPITFLGLAMGSLHVHFRHRIIERFRLRGTLLLLAAVSSLVLFATFLIFGRYLPVIGSPASDSVVRSALIKVPVFILVFSMPFYFFGRILTVCYHLNRDLIGQIYSADFFGAALACFLTPFCFHAFYLPGVIFFFTLAISCVTLLFLRLAAVKTIILGLTLLGCNLGLYWVIQYLDRTNNFQVFLPSGAGMRREEVAHAWNEFSRVSLVKTVRGSNSPPYYSIVHDNAVSNVHVVSFKEGPFRTPSAAQPMEAPFLLNPGIADILVMFAGCGAEMVGFYEFTGSRANITGVELNPLVVELARDTPELRDYRLREFYALPNVRMQVQEGRSFLQSDPNRYDLIFVGSKAATYVRLSGHTRKYLDTEEAYALYLQHLKKGGILLFDHQPIDRTLQSLKWVFRDLNLPSLGQCVIMLKAFTGGRDLLVAPGGFSPEAVARLLKADSKTSPNVIYAPHYKKNTRDGYVGIIESPLDATLPRTTDDRPYETEIEFKGYTPFPSVDKLGGGMYYASWIKITTMLFVGLLSIVLIAVTYLGKSRRLPPATLVYLLGTGFCYLLVEVVFIAKLELFMQDPLVSMATVLSIFLLTSGIGSLLFDKVAGLLRMSLFPFGVAALVFGSIFALNLLNERLLGLPLILRVAVAGATMAPVGLCLGLFYPFAVLSLVRHSRENAVPITYGISTLASVIGATYAMTMIINFGSDHLLREAAIGYALLGAFVLLYGIIAQRNVLTI